MIGNSQEVYIYRKFCQDIICLFKGPIEVTFILIPPASGVVHFDMTCSNAMYTLVVIQKQPPQGYIL